MLKLASGSQNAFKDSQINELDTDWLQRYTALQTIGDIPSKFAKPALAQPSASVSKTTSLNGSDLLSQRVDQLEGQLEASQRTPAFRCNCTACCAAGASDFGHLVSGAGSFEDEDANYNVQKTGNIGIDALLTGRKWNDKVITYSFYDGGSYYSNKQGLSEVGELIKGYVRHILEDLIEPLINLDFVEVSDAGDNYGQLRYMYQTGADPAYAMYPSNSRTGGDVFLDPNLKSYFEAGPGAFRYATLIHESMHAIGLKHPGDYNGSGSGDPPFLPYNEDNRTNTLMSYNSSSMGNSSYSGVSPMPYDIRALQYLYGAKAHQEGNTTYTFDTVYGYTVDGKFFGNKGKAVRQTIWDSKGLDTVDFSQLASRSSGYYFDLNDGGWLTTQSGHNGASYKAISDKSEKRYYTTGYGTAIAYDVTIENIVNSSSNDYIVLNQAANTISGYGAGKQIGDDIIVDANGQDTLDLSGYQSSAVTQTIQGNDLVLDLGGDGSITLKDYQSASQNNRIQILWNGDPVTPPIDPPTDTIVEVSFQQGVNGFTGTVDTFLNTNDSTPYANSTSLKTDGVTSHNGVEQVLLRFDNLFGQAPGQIASNAQIEAASLQLQVTNKGDSLELHRMLTPWSDTDTWYSLGQGIQANGAEAASTADAITGPLSVGLHSIDVTASLNAWLANPSSNHGWAILPTGSDGVYFNSAEGTTAPRLVVKYRVPAAPDVEGKTLDGTDGADQLQGDAGNDLIRGHHGDDSVLGLAGDDTLYGGEGVDTLSGGAGSDRLSGGKGKDLLTGGAGADTFAYRYIGHGGDTITDFEVARDQFDVSDIFASSKYGSANIFNDYIQVVGSSDGAKVRLDLQGDAGDQFKTLATLQGVDANSLSANHFIV